MRHTHLEDGDITNLSRDQLPTCISLSESTPPAKDSMPVLMGGYVREWVVVSEKAKEYGDSNEPTICIQKKNLLRIFKFWQGLNNVPTSQEPYESKFYGEMLGGFLLNWLKVKNPKRNYRSSRTIDHHSTSLLLTLFFIITNVCCDLTV